MRLDSKQSKSPICSMDNGIWGSSKLFTLMFMFIMSDITLCVYGSHSVFANPTPVVNTNITHLGEVTCILKGNTVLSITWKWRVGGNGNAPTYYFDVKTGEFPTGSLTGFSSSLLWKIGLSLEDRKRAGGTLYASASHGDDTTACTDVVLNVLWSPETAMVLPQGRTEIGNGTSLSLSCSSDDPGGPPGYVVWTKNGITAYTNPVGQGDLTINPVTEDINGLWRCHYKNDLGVGNSSNTLDVFVIWKAAKPTITDTQDRYVAEGKQFSLLCEINSGDRGSPEARVKWTLNNAIVNDYTEDMLTVKNFSGDDHAGSWRCFYRNSAGDGPASESANVYLGRKPATAALEVISPSHIITLASAVTLNCSTPDNGIPPGNVKWNRNGYTQVIINLTNVTRDHMGQWTCFFENHIGIGDTASKRIEVKWNVSSDNIILNGPKGIVTVGDEVTLNLSLSDRGNPPATPTWYHNGTKKDEKIFNDFVVRFENIKLSDSGTWACSASNGFSGTDRFTYTLRVMPKPPEDGLQIWVYIIIAVVAAILVIVIIVIIVFVTKKKKTKKSDTVVREHSNDQYAYNNKSFDAKTGTGHYDASKTNAGAEDPVYSAVSKGKPLAPIADGAVYSQVDLSKKTSRKSMKGLPMSKKAIDRIIFHKKDGYVNMTFQVRKKFDGDIEISVCRVGDQSCTSKVSKQHDGASKDVVMVLPIEDSSPDNYSIHIKFIERGQVTQTVDLTYPYNKNAVNVTVLNNVYGTNVSPSYADVEVEGVPSRPPRQGYPAEGVTYAVMDWDRSQAPGRPPRLSSRSPAQEHVVYADVRPGGNVY